MMDEETLRETECPGEDRLSAWFDGEEELDPVQLRHVEHCPVCQAYLAVCRRLADAVKRRETAEFAQKMRLAVRAKIEAAEQRKTRIAWTCRLIVFAFLTAFFIYLMLTHR